MHRDLLLKGRQFMAISGLSPACEKHGSDGVGGQQITGVESLQRQAYACQPFTGSGRFLAGMGGRQRLFGGLSGINLIGKVVCHVAGIIFVYAY
ncbi:MAG: hypothetical protein L0J54_05330 [Halomonas sp.]|nr:hypothetical protein [Halomonas sp.]MDN6297433.1 hypothetical protein [Halomonas sp.]MDN6314710.1 hypothetical protein [Halomonas sp.]MDN6336325.1 hypothetical protein [Halomonas sp.]